MPDLAEILPAQPEQRRPVHLGVAADVIMNPGMEGAAVAAVPGLLGLVLRLNEYRGRIPILPLPRQIIPALQQQDAFARRGEPVSQRAPSRAAADNDEIVTVRHAPAECQRGTNSALAGSGGPLQPRTGGACSADKSANRQMVAAARAATVSARVWSAFRGWRWRDMCGSLGAAARADSHISRYRRSDAWT